MPGHPFPLDFCALFYLTQNFTDHTDIFSLDVNIFCAFRGTVTFLSHTDFTDLTDVISLDVTLSVVSVVSV